MRRGARRLHVLLVGGRERTRRLLSGSLEDLDVTRVDGAAAAWRALTGRRAPAFDVIAVVCRPARRRLPAGVTLVHAIRKRWPWVPAVAILPVNGSEGLLVEAFRAGRTDFVDRARDLGHLAAWCSPSGSPEDQRIARVVTFIADHYTERLSGEDLARLAGLPPLRFARLFRMTTGSSLRDHVRTLRLRKAHELMETSSMTLTDVALESGFYDLPHFDKAFRRQFGMAPKDFKRGTPH